MPRYSAAYSGFVERLKEIDAILQMARQISRQPPTSANIALVNTLCRSGVVLLSSHIEGYVEDLAETAIDRIATRQLPKSVLANSFRYHLSRDLIKQIRQATDPSKVASKLDELLTRDGHIWDSRTHFSNSLSGAVFLADFANPTHDRIRKFFSRFGYDQYKYDLERRLAANYSACSNMVDQVVDQRNRIAHGDTTATGTPTDLSDMVCLVKQYCREADCIVGDWFRAQGCPVR